MQNTVIRAVSPEHPSPKLLSPMQQQPPLQRQSPIQEQLPAQQQPASDHLNTNVAFGPQLPPLSFGDLGIHQRTPLPPVAEASGTTTPEMRSTSTDAPTTVAQPYTGAVSPPSTQSVTTSQERQRLPSTHSEAPSSDRVSSPQPQPSSPPTSSKGKARERSISHGSLPSQTSPRQRGQQPIAISASQSTSDDRPPSRSSILTSPHSIVDKVSPSESAFTSSKKRASDTFSILSSPYSLGSIRRDLPPLGPPPDKSLPSEPLSDVQALIHEAGALYYVNNVEGDSFKQQPANRIPTTISEKEDSSSSEYDQQPSVSLSSPATSPPPTSVGPSSPNTPEVSKPVPVRQNAQAPFAGSTQVNRLSPIARSGLGRKPSGARELGTSRPYNNESLSSSPKPLAEEDLDSDGSMDASQLPPPAIVPHLSSDDPNLDVLAALSYMDVNGDQPPVGKSVEPMKIRSPEQSTPPSPRERLSATPTPVPPSNEAMQATQFRSSFAPSKQAAERKAKVQAQQKAHHAAAHKPGRTNGKRKSKMGGAWGESSEEEDEEEDDDDDEADSDDNGPASNKPYKPHSGNASSNTSIRPPQNQNPSLHQGDVVPDGGHPGFRGLRTLPQLPSGPPHGALQLKLCVLA